MSTEADKAVHAGSEDHEGCTLLLRAAEAPANATEMTRLLLAAKADVNATSKDRRNALLVAVENRQHPLMELLLEAGANVEGTGSYVTPLVMGIVEKDLASVQLLLAARADSHSCLMDGSNPLSMAVSHGGMAVLGELIQSKCDVNARDGRGNPPLHKAAAAGHPAMVCILVQNKADLAAVALDGSSALMRAVQANKVLVAQHLLEAGACVEQHSTHTGYSMLMYALLLPDGQEMVELLLHTKAGLGAVAWDGWNALMSSAVNASKSTIHTMLLDPALSGAINSPCTLRGSTPLHWAVRCGRTLDVISLFLQHGADVNQGDARGRTPVMWAVLASAGCKGRLILKHLVEARAGLGAEDQEGKRALDIARERAAADSTNKAAEEAVLLLDPLVSHTSSPSSFTRPESVPDLH